MENRDVPNPGPGNTPKLPSVVRDLSQLVHSGRRFRTVYADPPWPYSNTAARGAAENHYRTMTLDDIRGEIVRDLIEPDAHLHLLDYECISSRGIRRHSRMGFQIQVLPDLDEASTGHGQLLACLSRVSAAWRSRKSAVQKSDGTQLANGASHGP